MELVPVSALVLVSVLEWASARVLGKAQDMALGMAPGMAPGTALASAPGWALVLALAMVAPDKVLVQPDTADKEGKEDMVDKVDYRLRRDKADRGRLAAEAGREGR